MATSITWPPIGGSSFSIPAAGEVGWPSLSNFLIALQNAQSTEAQKIAIRTATTTPVSIASATDCVVRVELSVPGPSSVVLPAGVTGQYFVIVDGLGDASTNNITITANGAETINGQASLVIDQDYGAYALCFRSSNWTVVGAFGATGAGSVPRSDIAPGQPDYVVINNNLGELSEEQYLSQSRGGMGANVSAFTGVVKASAGSFSASTIVDADIDATAGIDATKIADGSVTDTEFQYLGGVTSDIQTQINNITGAGITSLTGDVTATGPGAAAATIANGAVTDAKVASGIDAAKLADGSVSNTEYQYLGGVTSDIQTQLNARATTTDLSNHINDTTTHGTTGNIVGDSDTQTLTNKTAVTLLLDDAADFEQITTPSNPAAGRSKIYPKSDGFFYTLDSSGTEVQIGSGGSGTGTLNIVDNPSAVSNTTGWTAATNYTVTRNTTDSPLEGVIDTCFAIVTSATSSETSTSGVYAASLAMPVALRNTKTQVSIYITTPSASTIIWKMSVYNASGTRMSLSSDSSGSTTLPANFNGQFVCTFDADSSATYTISFTQTGGATSSNTLYVTNISIGNGITAQGAAISEWQSYTPTLNSTTNVSSRTGFWRRVGSSMELQVVVKYSGTGAASGFTFQLPSGYTINTAALDVSADNTAVGFGNWFDSGVGYKDLTVQYANTTTFDVTEYNGTGLLQSNALSTNDIVSFMIFVPIAEWAGNGTVNLGQGAQATWAADDGTSDVFGPQGALVPNVGFGTGTTTRVFTFPYPQQATQLVTVELSRSGNGWSSAADLYPFSAGNNAGSTNFYGVRGEWTSSTTYQVSFGNQGTRVNSSAASNGTDAWSSEFSAGTRFRVVMATPSAPVGFGLAGTDGSAGLYKAGQAPGQPSNATISAGYIGEKLTFTSRSVSATTSGYTANSSALTTLTTGVWLIVPRFASNGGASMTGYGAFIATGTANANTEHIDSTIDTNFVYESNFGAAVPCTPIYYAVSGTQAIYVKAQSFGASSTITCTGYAVRIA